MPSIPRALSALTEQFLANYVPGVVRARIVLDDDTQTARDIYIDVAAGHNPEFVSRAVQTVMADRFMSPIPPHHVHLRETDEPQLRAEAEQMQQEHPELNLRDASPELDALLAAKAEGTDEASVFEFQRLRAHAWYVMREAHTEEIDEDIADEADAEEEAFETQRDAVLKGDMRTLIVAHPTIRDALVSGLLELLRDAVLTPAHQAKQDLTFLQDTLFSEWLVLAAERLGLPSLPFDDFPEDTHGIGPIVAEAIASPIPIVIAPSIGRYDNTTIEQRRQAMRDAVLGLVSLEDHVLQPAFRGHYDPLAVEAMLLVAWLSLAAEHAGATPDQIAAAIPVEGEPLDAIMDSAATALEHYCVEQGLVEAFDDE